jgi:hypothetical protein
MVGMSLVEAERWSDDIRLAGFLRAAGGQAATPFSL